MGTVSVLESLRAVLHRPTENSLRTPLELRAPAGAPPLVLRTMTVRDEQEWDDVRMRNADWLEPWESNDPMRHRLVTFPQWIAMQRRDERNGDAIVFVMVLDGAIIGQISLGAIFRGAMRTGIIGYWIDERYAGRSLTPLAVAMVCDWALQMPTGPRLHRMEIDLVPENERSRAVVRKVGARYEGVKKRYMYINGIWRDHESYSLLAEDAPQGFVRRLLSDTAKSRTSCPKFIYS